MPDYAPPALAIRTATKADAPWLTRVLTEAFFDDPVARWLFPDSGHRRHALPAFLRAHTDMSISHECAYTTDDLGGVALAAPSTALTPAWHRRLRATAGASAPALDTIAALEQNRMPRGQFGFVMFIGVSPSYRGQQLATRIVERVSADFAAQGLPQYCETSSLGGFRTVTRAGYHPLGAEIQLPHGPSLQPMLKPTG